MRSRPWTFGALAAAAAIIVWLELDRRRLRVALTEAQLAGAQYEMPRSPNQAPETRSSPERATSAPTVPTASVPSAEWIEGMQRRWDDPQHRAEALDAAFIRIEAKYGRLFERLSHWSPERKDALKALLAENELRQMQAAEADLFSMLRGDQTAGGEATARAMAENTERLRAMMGESDFEQLERLERAESARATFNPIVNALRAKGVPVSGDREEALLTTYADILRDAAEEASRVDPRSLTPAQQAELSRRQHEAFRVRLLQGMAGLLDERELETFLEAHIEQHAPPRESRRGQ